MNTSNKNYNHVIELLQDYMLSSSHFNHNYINNKSKHLSSQKIKGVCAPTPLIKNSDIFFFPNQTDSLFWCYYILVNDRIAYDMAKNNIFSIEKNYKINFVKELKEHKDILKMAKLKRTEIEDEFVNCPKLSIKGIEALCRINNINMFFIWENKYCEIISNDETPTFVIIEKKTDIDPTYGIPAGDTENTQSIINQYRKSHWKVDNPHKILKSIGSYKLIELQNICEKLQIPILRNGKKKTKKILYDDILHKI
jgi:hypothetical protein